MQTILAPIYPSSERFVYSSSPTTFKRRRDDTRYVHFMYPYQYAHVSTSSRPLALWEACYEALERGCILSMDDRSAITKGSCVVIVTLPEDHQTICLDKMLSLTTARMERQITRAQQSTGDAQTRAISFLADEISVVTCIVSFMGEAPQKGEDVMESGCGTSSDPRIPLPNFLLQQIKVSWRLFIDSATLWADHKVGSNRKRSDLSF